MTLIAARYTEMASGRRFMGLTEVEHETLLKRYDEQKLAQTGEQVDGELFIKKCEQEKDMILQQERTELIEAKRANRIMYWDMDRIERAKEFDSRRFFLVGGKSLHIAGFVPYPPSLDMIYLFNERFIEKPDDFTLYHKGETTYEVSIRVNELADDMPLLMYTSFGTVHVASADTVPAAMSSIAIDTFAPRQSKRKEYEVDSDHSLGSPMVYDLTIEPGLNQAVIDTAACYLSEHHPILAQELRKGNVQTAVALYKL